MTFDFLKRNKPQPEQQLRPVGLPDPGVLTEEPPAEDYEVKLTYRARSSKGVRFAPGEGSVAALPQMLEEYAKTPIELIEPLDPQFADANPSVMRTIEASQWLNAHHHRSPVTRYGLQVLETLDAIDPAFESIAMCLLDGDLDAGGYPDYTGIIGAVASYWDEVTGDQMVRGIVGWGGKGVRGDTERNATRLLGGILVAVVGSRGAAELVELDRPLPPDSGTGLVCPHCQFAQVGKSAFFCPKCGMRLLR
ncbi:MAG: hypothetical protein PVH07_08520, partial [Chloroflexota bacterium]